jgi:hypothetical protein
MGYKNTFKENNYALWLDTWLGKSHHIQKMTWDRCQWLTPVILTTQEAEIRKIEGQSQPGQTVWEILSQKSPLQKRAGGVTSVVEHLVSKREALSTAKKTPKKPKKVEVLVLLLWLSRAHRGMQVQAGKDISGDKTTWQREPGALLTMSVNLAHFIFLEPQFPYLWDGEVSSLSRYIYRLDALVLVPGT